MCLSKLLTVAAGVLAFLGIGGAGLRIGQASNETLPQLPKAGKVAVDLYGDPLPAGASARLGTTRFRIGNASNYHGFAFLPDGKTLVSATQGKPLVQFWEATTGKLLREIHTDKITMHQALAVNDKFIAVSGMLPAEEDGTVPLVFAILDIASGKVVRSYERPDSPYGPSSLHFTPDGKHLVVYYGDGLVRIEDVNTWKKVAERLFPRFSHMPFAALSPDGSVVAVAAGANVNNKLYVWRWQTSDPLGEIKSPPDAGYFMAFGPDGKMLAESSHSEGVVRVWDVAAGKLAYELKPLEKDSHWVNALAITPDGKKIVASCRSNTARSIHYWDATTGKHLGRLDAGALDGGGHRVLIVSPDGQLLAETGGGGFRAWDLVTGKEWSANREAHDAGVFQIAAKGNLVATTGYDSTIRLWDAITGKHRLKLGNGGESVGDIALSPDGTKLVSISISYENNVCLWDVASGQRIYKLPGHGRGGVGGAVGFTADGKHFLSWGDDMRLRKWDVATGKAVLDHALRPSGVVLPEKQADIFAINLDCSNGRFSPDGKSFVLIVKDSPHVFDVKTGKDVHQFSDEVNGISDAVAFHAASSDGRMLLTSAWKPEVPTVLPNGKTRNLLPKDHLVYLWELAPRQIRKKMVLPGREAGPVAFSPDGRLFAAAIGEPAPRIMVWDTAGGKEVAVIKGFRSSVLSLAFANDGRRLLSGMWDTTVLVWDISAFKPNAAISGK